ncbi:thermonuclease family protein [Kocuria marina]|uniref:thermonuclease family protein n=1 Tax=Kocuria marina TaxID=223184 RepID=UPI00381CD358
MTTVERVVDGDTLDATIAGKSTRVRLLNINTPEVARDGQPGECLADEATAKLEDLLPREPRSTWTTTWNARTATAAPSPE